MQNNKNITLRTASIEDKDIILEWRNDENTRNASFNPGILSSGEHERWFLASLSDPGRIIYIAETGGEKIGMVRLDKVNENVWEISINVAPLSRGKGLGAKIISMACESFSSANKNIILIARAKGSNTASEKVFKHAGFCDLIEYDGKESGKIQLFGKIT